MRDTSLSAYDQLKADLTQRQLDVYGIFRSYGDMTNYEASEKLGWPINRVSGRTGELVKLGKLFCIGKKYINGRQHRVLSLNPEMKLF